MVNGQLHFPAAFIPRKRALRTHWIRGWLGLRFGLDNVKKRQFFDVAGCRTPTALSQLPVGGVLILFCIPGECTNCVDDGVSLAGNRWTMPLLKLGEKRYYLGIFFKVRNYYQRL
jgi:hypothetical protein